MSEPSPLATAHDDSNRAATVSIGSAGLAIAALLNFYTGIAWLNPVIFITLGVLCSLVAIVSGHVGRRRARKSGGTGRFVSLLGIVLGWLVILVSALAVTVVFGLAAGVAVLFDTVVS